MMLYKGKNNLMKRRQNKKMQLKSKNKLFKQLHNNNKILSCKTIKSNKIITNKISKS